MPYRELHNRVIKPLWSGTTFWLTVCSPLTLLHLEQPRLYGVLAVPSAVGLSTLVSFLQGNEESQEAATAWVTERRGRGQNLLVG